VTLDPIWSWLLFVGILVGAFLIVYGPRKRSFYDITEDQDRPDGWNQPVHFEVHRSPELFDQDEAG
jgi:hypothetical protein